MSSVEQLMKYFQNFERNFDMNKLNTCFKDLEKKFSVSIENLADIVVKDLNKERDLCKNGGNKKLFEYQKKIIDHLVDDRGVIAAFATGTGKTFTAVSTAICLHKISLIFKSEINVLIICPASLVANMKKAVDDFNYFKGKFSNSVIVASSNAFRDHLLYQKMLRTNDKSNPKFMERMKGKELIKCDQKTFLIIDEAHEFKTDYGNIYDDKLFGGDETESRSKMFVEECYGHVWKILLMTATPFTNKWFDVMNLICAVKGVSPEYGSRHINYYETHNLPNEYKKYLIPYTKEEERSSGSEFKNISMVHPVIKDEDKHFFKNVIMFKDVDYSSGDFPARKEYLMNVEMTPEYFKQYEEVINKIRPKKSKKNKTDEDKEQTRLQEALSKIPDNPKDKEMENIVSSGLYDKIIIYSKFIDPLREIKKKFEKKFKNFEHYIITGEDVPPNKRDPVLKEINSKNKTIVYLSDAGGQGLDFKKIECVIIYEPGMNFSREEQVIGRSVRYKSHVDLPLDKQRSDVYRLFLTLPKNFESKHFKFTPDQRMFSNNLQKRLNSDFFRNQLIDLSFRD